MKIIERIKGFMSGNGGSAAVRHASELTSPNEYTEESVDQLIADFESKMDSKYNLTQLDGAVAKSNEEVGVLVDCINQCIIDLPSNIDLTTPSDSVIVETRTLEEIVNEVPDSDGSLLLKGTNVVKVNNTLYNALCSKLDLKQYFENGTLEILRLFPRPMVNKIYAYFTDRKLGQEIAINFKGENFKVLMDEFVKDGICYRKIRILDLTKHTLAF